jgi:hypothetical protein
MTVERARMVEWWPLVDMAKVEASEDDVVILRLVEPLSYAGMERLREEWKRAFPKHQAVVLAAGLEVIVKRAMPEMRAEDLVQPERKGTME